jgi:hypothetical protein
VIAVDSSFQVIGVRCVTLPAKERHATPSSAATVARISSVCSSFPSLSDVRRIPPPTTANIAGIGDFSRADCRFPQCPDGLARGELRPVRRCRRDHRTVTTAAEVKVRSPPSETIAFRSVAAALDRGCVETRRNFANDRWSAPLWVDRIRLRF